MGSQPQVAVSTCYWASNIQPRLATMLPFQLAPVLQRTCLHCPCAYIAAASSHVVRLFSLLLLLLLLQLLQPV
jgi:hypothetical protein